MINLFTALMYWRMNSKIDNISSYPKSFSFTLLMYKILSLSLENT